ncbi:virulence-associated V antigen [Aeromonas veronii]|uniref:virulence-associated V antigen n=1 Tax=Aeromonas veronii TaxID=654 RepID=UPI00343CC7DA
MEISSYKKDPQNFLSELGKVELNQLRGADSTALADLLALLQRENVKITARYDAKIDSVAFPDLVVTDNEALLRKLLAYFLPPDATIPGGLYDAQLKGGFENFKKIIMEAAAAGKRDFTLREFLAVTKFSLTPDRIDDDVIEVMTDAMSYNASKRDKLRNEINGLTAELKIYVAIQNYLNQQIANNIEKVKTDSQGLNLMDRTLYGYSDDESFRKSQEFKILINIQENRTVPDSELANIAIRQQTIQTYLGSAMKFSGAMTGVHSEYTNTKDQRDAGTFLTAVSDKARTINDEVSKKTTLLNDFSSRYNSAIEALNRFIQKYESVMRDILQAI